jgi:hypothetical protein
MADIVVHSSDSISLSESSSKPVEKFVPGNERRVVAERCNSGSGIIWKLAIKL